LSLIDKNLSTLPPTRLNAVLRRRVGNPSANHRSGTLLHKRAILASRRRLDGTAWGCNSSNESQNYIKRCKVGMLSEAPRACLMDEGRLLPILPQADAGCLRLKPLSLSTLRFPIHLLRKGGDDDYSRMLRLARMVVEDIVKAGELVGRYLDVYQVEDYLRRLCISRRAKVQTVVQIHRVLKNKGTEG
jgi:hypothetical protein